VHDAGAALAGVAADMRAGEAELVAQEIDEQGAVLGIGRYRLPVHLHGNGCHGSTLMDGDAESFGIPLPAVKGGSSPPHQRSTAPKITSRITTTPTRPTTQISGANPSLRMVGTGAGRGAASTGGSGASSTGACASFAAKRPKKSSAICLAAPSMRRWPICASLPPTEAFAV